MASAGRGLKYTPERAERVLMGIRACLTYAHAAQSAGISEDTLAAWRKGRAGAPSDFSERFLQAEGESLLLMMNSVRKDPDWRAQAWILEHRWPQHYGKQVHEVQGKDGQDLVFTLHLDRPSGVGADDANG